ncbi:MAG: ABC transporter permease [Alphaproteobacteria bacterium]|nr:ABC transporter permease [Alphaproteobacteria bacterium]
MVVGGAVLLSLMLSIAIVTGVIDLINYLWEVKLGPDPMRLNPIKRLRPPQEGIWFGTDMFGRDLWARALWGSQISLVIGLSVAVLSTVIGLAIGLLVGYNRIADAIIMRIMDGLMAIPTILLAIALVSLFHASVTNVIIAITIPEVPRVVRLVRSVVLTIREMPYVEAAVSIGTRTDKVLFRHILPNTLAPLIVQATYVCAAAVLIEAILSFLGAGTPPETPSWGNVMAEGRTYFQIAPWIIFFPGVFLALTVLAINVMGDGLRDTLDPRIARRMK